MSFLLMSSEIEPIQQDQQGKLSGGFAVMAAAVESMGEDNNVLSNCSTNNCHGGNCAAGCGVKQNVAQTV